MPRALHKTKKLDPPVSPGRIVPFSPSGAQAPSREAASLADVPPREVSRTRISRAQSRAGEVPKDAGPWAAAYHEAQRRTIDSYHYVSSRSRSFVCGTLERGREAKNEHPIELLGAIAGAAFTAGILIRIWRSVRDA